MQGMVKTKQALSKETKILTLMYLFTKAR